MLFAFIHSISSPSISLSPLFTVLSMYIVIASHSEYFYSTALCFAFILACRPSGDCAVYQTQHTLSAYSIVLYCQLSVNCLYIPLSPLPPQVVSAFYSNLFSFCLYLLLFRGAFSHRMAANVDLAEIAKSMRVG